MCRLRDLIMFRFGPQSKGRVAPAERLKKELSLEKGDGCSNDKNATSAGTKGKLSDPKPSLPTTNAKFLNILELPPEFSKEFQQLFKTPEFGSKYSATINHLVHNVDFLIDEMIVDLFPIMTYFLPNLIHEPPLRSSSSLDALVLEPKPSSSTTSQSFLIHKLSEMNCCLWIIQESFGPLKSSPKAQLAHLKLSLRTFHKKLRWMKKLLASYLYKFETQHHAINSVSSTMKYYYRKHKGRASEHHEKYLANCEPDFIHSVLVQKFKNSEPEDSKGSIKFNCTPSGYNMISSKNLHRCAEYNRHHDTYGANILPQPISSDLFWSASYSTCTSSLPPKLQSEISYSILRELEYRIHATITETPVILSKLRKSYVGDDGIHAQTSQLLRLIQFAGMKLTTNAAVSILFSFKRVKAKMELFKRLLLRFENSISLVRKRISMLCTHINKLNRKMIGGRSLSNGPFSEQMLRYSRHKIMKMYDKLEITIYTDWPDCFKEYILGTTLESDDDDEEVNEAKDIGQGDNERDSQSS